MSEVVAEDTAPSKPSFDITSDEITVRVKHEAFTFSLPGPRAMARLGTTAQRMRMLDGGATEYGLDGMSIDLYRAFALFETLLIRADSDSNWVFSIKDGKIATRPDGKPLVDSNSFPPNKTLVIQEAGAEFEKAMGTFLTGGSSN